MSVTKLGKLLRWASAFKYSRYFVIESVVKSKGIVIHSITFPGIYDWFSGLSESYVIGQNGIWWLLKLKIEGQTIYRKPHRKVTTLKSKFHLFLG